MIDTNVHSNLGAALVNAQEAARAVDKDSKNAYHHYKYASSEAIIAESRGALVGAGLAFFNTGCTLDDRMMLLTVHYRLIHTSGEFLDFSSVTPVIEDKARPLDKAVFTAMTYNLGYFLRGLLLLPRVEPGTEVDDRDDRDHKKRVPMLPRHNDHDEQLADNLAESLFQTFIGKLEASSHDALPLVAKEIQGLNLPEMYRKPLSDIYKARRLATKLPEAAE